MASRINNKIIFPTFFILVCFVLGLLLVKHYEITTNDIQTLSQNSQNALLIASAEAGVRDLCKEDEQLTVFSPTVYICNEQRNSLVYGDIYRLYPVETEGVDVIYSFIDTGEKARADEMLEDIYNINRYDPVTLPAPLTWTEDPYDEQYWRFIFYSLRPLRHLLATAEETHAERYYEKTREILDSFLTVGIHNKQSWDDAHAVAFRTMVLVHAWWQLREVGELPSDLSDKILTALEIHGDFLLDPDNYESDYNHAITQSSALLLVAQAFPDLANAEAWKETAARRISISLSSIVDPDGVLKENSPFYHFYSLEKYWEINQYAQEQNIEIEEDFDETITNMVNFATYVLRPDRSVPLLGASIPRTINASGPYAQMARNDSEFEYVLTEGQSGEQPELTSVLFDSSGIALLRSAWNKYTNFADETQILFDTGPYRTDHSDLDALTFSLFSYGTPIVRDAGLYTYEINNQYFNYFHGTRGHNTIIVDGLDQAEGVATQNDLVTEDQYSYLAAQHTLYDGVDHHRTVLLLEHDIVLIFDELRSDDAHTYEQLFHFAPGTELNESHGTQILHGTIPNEDQTVYFSLQQLIPPQTLTTWEGSTEPMRGFCATGYEVLASCPEAAFGVQASNTRFISFIQFGNELPTYQVNYNEENNTLRVQGALNTYDIHITYPEDGIIDSDFINLDVSVINESDSFDLQKVRSFFNEIF